MQQPTTSPPRVHILESAPVQCALTTLRAADTPLPRFREGMRLIGAALAFEALRHRETRAVALQTPLGPATGAEPVRPVVLTPVLRAGLGLAEAMLAVVPDAAIGHIGMFRDETTLRPVQYYFRLPPGIAEADVIVVDPMLATGNSAVSAISLLKQHGARRLCLAAVVGCPEGVNAVHAVHPEIMIHLAALDAGLNSRSYIVPGLGDAGDRFFGT